MYSRSGGLISSVDAASLQVDDGLVFFHFRELRPDFDTPFNRPVYAATDCEHRWYANVVPGSNRMLRVYEGTPVAARTDLVCRLAGLATRTATPPSAPATSRDWRLYQSEYGMREEVDALSVRAEADHIRYAVRRRYGASEGDLSEAVADCARLQRADVVRGEFTLQSVPEDSVAMKQVRLACGLPAAPAAPVELRRASAPRAPGLARPPRLDMADPGCRPVDPPAAAAARAHGMTRLRLRFDADGHVTESSVVASAGDTPEHALLDEAARVALARCPISPGTDDAGHAVASSLDVAYYWHRY